MNKIVTLREKREFGKSFLSVINSNQAAMLRSITGKTSLDYRDMAGLSAIGFLFVIDSN